jgi:hypothetical protein
MKKSILVSAAILLFSISVMSADFSLHLNINYNLGISDFFDESQTFLSYSGKNFVEKRNNHMGMGFNIAVSIPVIKRFYIRPGFSIQYGYQDYEFSELNGGTDGESEKNTFFFRIFSGELNVVYDLIRFKDRWNVNLLVGLNYNTFKPGDEMRVNEEKYWSFRTGIGATFVQLKHFGFQIFAYYDIPLNSDLFSYAGGSAGVFYRF